MINPLHYDHLPYIAAAYGLFLAAILTLALGARTRLARVGRRLRAADPRARLKGATP
jgi:hypothetical protein